MGVKTPFFNNGEKMNVDLIIKNIFPLILILISFSLGIKIPDWDFKFKIRHRNILTHSPLITLILIISYQASNKDYILKYFIIGFSLAIGIHMLFDIFPKKWIGGALLKIPFKKNACSKEITINFFILTIIFGFFTTIFYCENFIEYLFIIFLSIFSMIKKQKFENSIYKPILIFFIIITVFAYLKFKLILFL